MGLSIDSAPRCVPSGVCGSLCFGASWGLISEGVLLDGGMVSWLDAGTDRCLPIGLLSLGPGGGNSFGNAAVAVATSDQNVKLAFDPETSCINLFSMYT